MKSTQYSLSQIWIYPVKSLAGIALTEAIVEEKGLKYDRRWVIVDENNKFINQRTYPKMALIHLELEIENDVLKAIVFSIKTNEKPDYRLINPEVTEKDNKQAKVQVWDDIVDGIVIKNDINDWLSDILGTKCKLIYMPNESRRMVEKDYAITGQETTSFSDGYPYLIIGEEALKLLNSKLAKPITINRFRPNLVFKGGQPHEEDEWKNFNIGNTAFVGVKNCARCVMLSIDPLTAEKSSEPLKTLNGYRSRNKNIYFGQNLLVTKFGKIAVGNSIEVN
jgi:uncharacterized protein